MTHQRPRAQGTTDDHDSRFPDRERALTRTAAPTASGRPVAAVITDGPEAVAVARCAVRIALEQNRPMLLLVPTLRSAFGADSVVATRVQQAGLQAARAVAARIRPTLDAAGVSAPVVVVLHRACPFRRARQVRAIALAHTAGRIGAGVVVTPAELPVPTVTYGAAVLLVTTGAPIAVRRPARSRRLAQL